MKPFIYICALPRTGSTILAESLMRHPTCFIHNESFLAEGHYYWNQIHLLSETWPAKQLVIKAIEKTMDAYIDSGNKLGFNNVDVQTIYRDHFIKIILSEFHQTGIKEISNSKWRDIYRAIPNTKAIITCRDPRDIYASIIHMRTKFGLDWEWASINAEQIANKLLTRFNEQKLLMQEQSHIVVRYEDFCRSRNEFNNVVKFINSDIEEPGDIACYNVNNALKNWENTLHNGKIGERSVGRWKTADLESRSFGTFCDCMYDYIRYFNY